MFSYDVSTAEMFIYGDIFPAEFGGVDDSQVVEALAEMKGRRVTARINSMGGSVTIMRGIYNALERHSGGVDTVNDGMAASAGHYIWMVGENRTMAKNSNGFIHSPLTLAVGNAKEMRAAAEMLDSVGSVMAETYAEKTGKPMSQIQEWLDNETWFNAQESLEHGFATAIGRVVKSDAEIAASVAAFKASLEQSQAGVPPRVKEQVQQEAPYRVAAKLQAIKSKNRSSQLLTNAKKFG